MKQTQIIIVILCTCLSCFGQTIPVGDKSGSQILEPEFADYIVYIDSSKSVPLERQIAQVQAKASVSAYVSSVGKTKAFNHVNGSMSTVRVRGHNSVKFIVRVLNNSVDPFKVVNIFRLEPDLKKNLRTLHVTTHSAMSGTKSEIEFVRYTATKYGASSYLVNIDYITPGEYAITLDGSRLMFNLFGVD